MTKSSIAANNGQIKIRDPMQMVDKSTTWNNKILFQNFISTARDVSIIKFFFISKEMENGG